MKNSVVILLTSLSLFPCSCAKKGVLKTNLPESAFRPKPTAIRVTSLGNRPSGSESKAPALVTDDAGTKGGYGSKSERDAVVSVLLGMPADPGKRRQPAPMPPLPASYLVQGATDASWTKYLEMVDRYLDSPAKGDGPYLLRLRAALDSERWMATSGRRTPLAASVVDRMNDVLARIDQRLSTYMSLASTYKAGPGVGGPPISGPFVWPLERMHITSPFGYRRDPFLGVIKFHDGIDLSAVPGTIVHAAADGRVIHAGEKGLFGLAVVIDHGDGHRTLYGHLENVLVRVGHYVRRGDAIGQVGSTGRSTGPHLHFSVYYRGRAVDPLEVLPGLLQYP